MLLFWPSATALPATFPSNKNFWEHSYCQGYPKKNFSPFCSASTEIIGVKVCNRWMDRQTDKFFDTINWGYVDFFFQLNLLHPYLLRSQGIILFAYYYFFWSMVKNQIINPQISLTLQSKTKICKKVILKQKVQILKFLWAETTNF